MWGRGERRVVWAWVAPPGQGTHTKDRELAPDPTTTVLISSCTATALWAPSAVSGVVKGRTRTATRTAHESIKGLFCIEPNVFFQFGDVRTAFNTPPSPSGRDNLPTSHM